MPPRSGARLRADAEPAVLIAAALLGTAGSSARLLDMEAAMVTVLGDEAGMCGRIYTTAEALFQSVPPAHAIFF
jgi:hypothetical protein